MVLSRNDSGFTLLEILIAITILSVALIGMAGLLTTNVKSISRGKYQLIGLNLAQEKLEDLKMVATTNFAAAEVTPTLPESDPIGRTGWEDREIGGDAGALVNFTGFTRETYIIDKPDANGIVNLKDIAVVVEWTDVSGNHDVMVRTSIAR